MNKFDRFIHITIALGLFILWIGLISSMFTSCDDIEQNASEMKSEVDSLVNIYSFKFESIQESVNQFSLYIDSLEIVKGKIDRENKRLKLIVGLLNDEKVDYKIVGDTIIIENSGYYFIKCNCYE